MRAQRDVLYKIRKVEISSVEKQRKMKKFSVEFPMDFLLLYTLPTLINTQTYLKFKKKMACIFSGWLESCGLDRFPADSSHYDLKHGYHYRGFDEGWWRGKRVGEEFGRRQNSDI